MLKRKIMEKLVNWKNSNKKECLLIKGARQVGKIFIIREFAKENYKNVIEINFELQKDYKRIFDGNLDINTLINNIELNFPDNKIIDGDTLIFLDEIQACPNARVALKSFAEDKRIDVIASGSLLGLYYKEVSSYPVGYEKEIELHPFDFEEFLWAIGISESIIDKCRRAFINKEQIDEFILDKMSEYFNLYIMVGGMPGVVNSYLEEKRINDAIEEQNKLITNYKRDVLKYADEDDKQKILRTFESIPYQLSKKNKKFVYSDIKDNKYKEGELKYFSSLSWLRDAGIIQFCYNLNEPALPLASNIRQNSFKVYMKDTGLLLSTMENNIYKSVINNDIYVNEGALLENVCASELSTRYNKILYYEKKSKLEIDFILNIDGYVVALEVKSGNNRQSKSLDSMINNYKTVERYIKLENDNKIYVDKKNIEHYPLFMIMFL